MDMPGPSSRPWPSLQPYPVITSSSKFDIRIKLTSSRKPEDTRYLTLAPGKSCMIGRASKNKGEVHQASPTNGLFDCPVVSRQHAELRAHLWSATGDQVTIVDYGSMHGTRVNHRKLETGRSMALRDNDVIEFGDKVTRGDDTHDSVMVKYQRLSNEESNTLAPSQQAEGIGYRGQSYSDEEEEEEFGGSDYDEISVISDDGHKPHQSSSAKTTPEQRKGSLGSQENPIELESVRPNVIDLTDDEGAEYSPVSPLLHPVHHPEQLVKIDLFDYPPKGESSSQPQILDSNKVVKDSVDQNNSFYQPIQPHLSGVININDDEDRSTSVSGDSEMSDPAEDFEFMIGNDESEVEDLIDDEEDADDDEDDIDYPEEPDEEDANSLYDPDSYEPNKEPSPELGSDTGFIGGSSPAPINPNTSFDSVSANTSPQHQPAPQPSLFSFPPLHPPYDPVRASGYPGLAPPPPPPPSVPPTRYGPWDTGSPFPDFHMPFGTVGMTGSNASRPLGAAWSPPFGTAFMAPPFPPPTGHIAPPPPPPLPLSGMGAVNHYPARPPPPPHAMRASPRSPSFMPPPRPQYYSEVFKKSYEAPKNQTSIDNFLGKPKSPGEPKNEDQKQKGRDSSAMSIGELVEDQGNGIEKSLVAEGSNVAAGTKRKVAEISEDVTVQLPQPTEDGLTALTELEAEQFKKLFAAEATIDAAYPMVATDREETSEGPAPRRRRMSVENDVSTAVAVEAPEINQVREVQVAPRADSTVGSFAKMAGAAVGSAVLGGAATMAFLCSPLAERAIEYLA